MICSFSVKEEAGSHSLHLNKWHTMQKKEEKKKKKK